MSTKPKSTWAEEYLWELCRVERKRNLVLRAERNTFLHFQRQDIQSAEKVLEIGSGIGFLRRNWPKYEGLWVELDSQPLFLKEAGRRYTKGTYVSGSAYELPFPDKSFDAVVGLDSFDIFSDLEIAVNEASRVLKKGGIFLHMSDLGAPRGDDSLQTTIEANIDFASRLIESLKLHFNPATIESLRVRSSYRGIRTEQQRESGHFLFIEDTGRTFMSPTPYNNPFIQHYYEFHPLNRILWRAAKSVYEGLRRISPTLAQFYEPQCLEISCINYVKARK